MTVGAWIRSLQQFDEGLEVVVRMGCDEDDNLYIATKPHFIVDAGCTETEALCIDMAHEDEGMEEVPEPLPMNEFRSSTEQQQQQQFRSIIQGIERLEKLMSSVAQGFSDLQNAINALTAEEGSVVAAIQALQAQVAAGSPVTGAQLEALVTQVNSVTSGLQAAIAPPATSTSAAPAPSNSAAPAS